MVIGKWDSRRGGRAEEWEGWEHGGGGGGEQEGWEWQGSGRVVERVEGQGEQPWKECGGSESRRGRGGGRGDEAR